MKTIKRLLLLAVFLCFAHVPARALFDNESVVSKFSMTSVAASTNAVIVDLSDTANFTHEFTGGIEILSLRVSIEKIAASSGTIKIGVVSACNVSVGTVTYFAELRHNAGAAGYSTANLVLNDAVIYATVGNDEIPKGILSNDRLLSSTAFQTDVTLPSPIPVGASFPGKGDIVMTYTTSDSVLANITVEVIYNSVRP